MNEPIQSEWKELIDNLVGAVAVEVTIKGHAIVKVNDQEIGNITRSKMEQSFYSKSINEVVEELENDR